MASSATLVTVALLLLACGEGSSERNDRSGAGGTGGSNANAAGAPHTPRLEYCEGSSYWCCDRDNGHEVSATCGPDGRWLPCTGNTFHPTSEPVCSPESLPVADCQELQGLVCEPGNECHNWGACSTFCTCEVMGGGYLWQCLEHTC